MCAYVEIFALALFCFGFTVVGIFGIFKEMDASLNYSMKRKVRWGIFKNLYSDNRAKESFGGCTIEQPNVGVYFPVCIFILIKLLIDLVALVWGIVLIIVGYSNRDVKIMDYTVLALMFVYSMFLLFFAEYYKKKYPPNQVKNILKISQIIKEREKAISDEDYYKI